MGAKAKVVITDYVWESLDVEHNTLGESGRGTHSHSTEPFGATSALSSQSERNP